MSDNFWAVIDAQLTELTRARTAQEVVTILSQERNPYNDGPTGGDGFFAGSGGDGTVREALQEAGWRTIWSDASYYYAMRAPDGSAITYVEGDIYTEDQRANEPAGITPEAQADGHRYVMGRGNAHCERCEFLHYEKTGELITVLTCHYDLDG